MFTERFEPREFFSREERFLATGVKLKIQFVEFVHRETEERAITSASGALIIFSLAECAVQVTLTLFTLLPAPE